MAFETVEGTQGDFSPTWDFGKDGALTGVYVGSREVETRDTINGGTRQSTVYEFVNEEDGKKYGLWGSSDLDSKFEQISAPARVRVEFDKMEMFRTKSGQPRNIKRFNVAVDTDWDGTYPEAAEPLSDDDIPF